jgi:pimeloyl-ACP methyl ester carboxylesterase
MKSKFKKLLMRTLFVLLMLVSVARVYFEIEGFNYELALIDMKKQNELEVKMNCEMEDKVINVNGCEIHYVISKKRQEKSVVFLHAAFSDHSMFLEQFDSFSDDYTVIAIDLLGHGLSKPKKSDDKIDASRDHLSSVLEEENIEQTNLVGVSIGSLIAQYFALKYPEKVTSLTALGGYDINQVNPEIAKTQRFLNIGLVMRALFSMKAFRKKTAEISCESNRGQALFYQSTNSFRRSSFPRMQGLTKVVVDRDIPEPFYPMFIVTAEFDIELARRMALNWHTENKNSEYYMMMNAGHCANLDKPTEFNNVVKDFLDRNNDIKPTGH